MRFWNTVFFRPILRSLTFCLSHAQDNHFSSNLICHSDTEVSNQHIPTICIVWNAPNTEIWTSKARPFYLIHQKSPIAPTAIYHRNFFRAKASWYLGAGLVRRNSRNMTVNISVNAWIPSFLKLQFNPTFRPHITSTTSIFSQFNTQHW
jgi:hypothetical protein